MRITRLALRDVRRYRDLDVELAPGLTVVRGPNEAGKTTMQRAIELALTRKATSANADLEAIRSWDAQEDGRPEIELDFTDEDEDGVRSGSLLKSYRGAKGTARLEIDGEVITDPARVDERLAELTGVPTEAFFRSTASVRHHEVADLDRDEATLRDRLQASISGADRGTSRAKKQLDRAIRELGARGEKNPGRLKVAEEAVDRATAAVDAGEAALAQLERDRDALTVARGRRTESEAALAERKAMLEKARQAERLNAERAAADERYQRYRQAVEVNTELDQLSATHPSATPLPVLRPAVERLRALDGRIRELNAALAGEIEVSFEVPPEPTWRPLSRVAVVAVLLGVAAVVGGLVARSFDVGALADILTYGGAVGVALGVILAVVGLWLRRKDRLSRQLRDVEIDRRLRGRSEMEADLRSAQEESQQRLGTIAATDLAGAEALLTAEEEHVGRIDRLTGQLEGLVGKEPAETLAQQRDAAALEMERKTHALEELGPIAREPRARERLEVEVRDQEAALERARDDEAGARARVEANGVDAEQVAAQAEQLTSWREQLGALQRRSRVYGATLAAIEAAEAATMRTATRYLEKRMVTDLDRITGGRYRRVRVDDTSLDMALWAPELGDWVPVSQVSQGTLDLVYLAARLGLVRLVTGGRRPPLLFDDPFVTLDDARATRAIEVLRDLASDFQVIYLTTSDRYDAFADEVVELPAPQAVDDSAPVDADLATTGRPPAD